MTELFKEIYLGDIVPVVPETDTSKQFTHLNTSALHSARKGQQYGIIQRIYRSDSPVD